LMRRYSNGDGMENGGTEMYERVFTTRDRDGTGRQRTH